MSSIKKQTATLVAINKFVMKILGKVLDEFADGSEILPEVSKLWNSDEVQAELKTIVTKPPKKPVDEEAPKKPQSAYLLFCADRRPAIQSDLEKKTGGKVKVTE